MDLHSKELPTTEANTPREFTVRTVLNIYGVFLFLGLVVSIFTHGVEDINGFLFFILISSVLYFLLLNLYFTSELWRKVVFITICLMALFSLFMVFYLQMNTVAH
jgi:glucan phosphoethanolaminetransferase (alkaline phosphatase superfamily)